MADSITIWRVAGVINSLASQLDMLSSRKDLSLRVLALSLDAAVSTANTEIRKITASDGPAQSASHRPNLPGV